MAGRARLAQQVEFLAEALGRLEEALAMDESEIVRDAVIKRFEFTFEIAWKAMYRWLQWHEVDVPQEAFRVLPRAFSAGLVDDDAAWTAIRRARTLTSHTYDARKAVEVAATARAEAPRFRALLERLRMELTA